MNNSKAFTAALVCLSINACKVEIEVPSSGEVTTSSGAYSCAAGQTCSIDVNDIYFDETFVAEPADGFVFTHWKQVNRSLCAGGTASCRLETSGFEGNEALTAILEDPDEVYYLEPNFQSTGFKSLFIGHSFFRPFADAMPEHAARAGIPNHTQSVVFSGGGTGAPEALWNNPQKGPQIRSILDGGDIELFVMTYHPDYPGFNGYRLWIDYALEQNPDTRIALALPWGAYPEDYDAAGYEVAWEVFQAGEWHGGIELGRSRYPSTEIFSIPYGRAAIELRNLFVAGQLSDVDVLTSKTGEAIFRDALGHADQILVDLGELVWLRAIYGIDLTTYDFDPGYEADLKAIAQQIMDEHGELYEIYDAPYR
ncbi:MAG: hypothetical protein AAGA91_12885 [Pseudomonadota bacterium]